MKGAKWPGVVCSLLAATAWPLALQAAAVGTTFTYQGRLETGGSPADGAFDFRFALYDDPDFGSQVGPIITIEDQQVTKGLFTVSLDFGDVFDGTALWLYVLVRPGDSTGAYTPLLPRQPLHATPYALHALAGGSGTSPWQSSGSDIYYNDGNVGIGTDSPGSLLTIDGLIESLTGGFRFPDGSTATSFDHGQLTGLGDNDHPQYILHNETNSVTSAMIQNEAITREKITTGVPGAGQVLEWNGSNIVWANDDTGGSQWASDTNGIFYSGHVGIGANSSADYDLNIEGDLRVTHSAVLTGDVTLGCASCDPVRVEDNIEIGGNVTIDWLSGGSGTTVVWGSNNRLYKLSSSLRYKHNVADLPATQEAVLRLRPVTFTWNSTGEADIGLIAEEVAEVIPDLVLYDAEGRPDGVKYDRLSVCLLQVVESQRGQIADLTVRLERMEAMLAELVQQNTGGGK